MVNWLAICKIFILETLMAKLSLALIAEQVHLNGDICHLQWMIACFHLSSQSQKWPPDTGHVSIHSVWPKK